ncbi:hypothetical protein [Mammaliicoccus sciuri]|uniref:hypothetical protein n=1 Tax=Mammaliicoccus sciuri TaxID=1296 RepID=UPI001C1DECDC|nr:hypothetical protein [Mammaliicoccus sciuri]MBU6089460.1 hypothetical protein [Mammaliicoccus sciuri]MBW3109326.1 hypothetical protein [Mammaliicoccus sciuri]
MTSNSTKEEILLNSFNILKENLNSNIKKISEIINKVSKINFDLSIEMWKYILIEGESYLKLNGYFYTGSILYNMSINFDDSKVISVIEEHEEIFVSCYNKSSDIYHYLVSDMFESGKINLADRTIELIYQNKVKENPFVFYLIEICEYFDNSFKDLSNFDPTWMDNNEHESRVNIASEGSQVLLKWIDKIKDKEQKSSLMVSMVDYV